MGHFSPPPLLPHWSKLSLFLLVLLQWLPKTNILSAKLPPPPQPIILNKIASDDVEFKTDHGTYLLKILQ